MSSMVISRSPTDKAQNRERLDSRRIRARLLLEGHTLQSFARIHGVSGPCVSRLIAGVRPGLTGRSAAIMAKLREAAQ